MFFASYVVVFGEFLPVVFRDVSHLVECSGVLDVYPSCNLSAGERRHSELSCDVFQFVLRTSYERRFQVVHSFVLGL